MALYFEWSLDMSVGKKEIDDQHKKLLGQINKIIDSLVYGVKSTEVHSAIQFFDVYAKDHLKYEEKYMEEIGYPHLDHHKKDHQEFLDNYKKLKERLDLGIDEKTILIEIENYLGTWWINHIGEEDKKYHLYQLEKKK